MPDCPLGVHDGPKVAMPGDRLVNGAGVSLRLWGQSTIGSKLADTDGRNRQLSTNLRWAIGKNRLATAGWSTSAVQCNWRP